jgi:hypothetical protein
MKICCSILENDIYDASETERYSLGIKGQKTLFCIGINPSTACPNNYDNTMKRLKKIVEKNKKDYDSWTMLNIYPQRTTDPNNLDIEEKFNKIIHKKNLQIIDQYIKNDSKILCSWGTLINERIYLKNCLKEIYVLLNKKLNIKYFHIDELTKDGHPMHILYAKMDNGLNDFVMDNYIKNI